MSKQYISFDLSEYLKKLGVIGISYQTNTRRIYISFNDSNKKTIIIDVYGDDIKKTVESFKKQVKGTMNHRNQDEFVKTFSDNWYKIFQVLNGDADTDNVNPADPNAIPTTATQNPNQNVPLTKAELIIEKAKDNIIRLFIDEYKEAHAAIRVKDHLEVLSLNSSRFRDWLSRILYKEENEVINENIFKDAMSVLNAEAAFDSGDPLKLSLRVAQKTESIIAGDAGSAGFRIVWYYDLTNTEHEFIEITSEGWNIIKNKDLVIFRRFNNQASQVYPLRSGKYSDFVNTRIVSGEDMFDKFIDLLLNKNVKEDNRADYRLLLKTYVISLFVPDISKPVFLPHGSQGAAKSTMFEKIKEVVDPSILKTLSFPRDKNEFIQQLAHNYVSYYDNISSILRPWISDEVCRAVSGSGSSLRRLYTDDEDKIRSFKRCIGINGINLAATKPDLLDRGLIFQLQRIEKHNRLREQIINEKFEKLRPYVLGYILDTLVKVLRFKETEETGIEEYPRMADFSEYGEIIARCMGYEAKKFLEAYDRNTQLQIDEVIESSEVATCIMHMMFVKYKNTKFKTVDGNEIDDWIGTPSALLGELNSVAIQVNIDTGSKYWPKAAHILSMRLNEIMPTLKEKGLDIELLKNQGEEKSRGIKLSRTRKEASPASPDK